jgi:hypothetical protein
VEQVGAVLITLTRNPAGDMTGRDVGAGKVHSRPGFP